MAFLQKIRDLNKLKVCSDLLPWVVTGKHLGTRIENKPDNILNQDVKEKRAQYIQRNNELRRCIQLKMIVYRMKIPGGDKIDENKIKIETNLLKLEFGLLRPKKM